MRYMHVMGNISQLVGAFRMIPVNFRIMLYAYITQIKCTRYPQVINKYLALFDYVSLNSCCQRFHQLLGPDKWG